MLKRLLKSRLSRRNYRKERIRTLEQLEPRLLMNSTWQNPARPLDVNNDRRLSALDALNVINRLNQPDSTRVLPLRTNPLDRYYDTSGDGRVSALDALQVINALNQSDHNPIYAGLRIEGESEIAPAGFISMPLLVMPGSSRELIELTTSMSINAREFNEMGLFVVDDADGRVDGVSPSSADYGRAVFESEHRRVLYSKADILRTSNAVVLPAGRNVRVYVLQPSTDNGDPAAHLRVRQTSSSNMRIGWEEHAPTSSWPSVGDRGYDDVIVDVQLGIPFPGREAPVIEEITNRSHPEQTELIITPTVTDSDLPDDTLSFSLDIAPPGASIDSSTGRFRWTPTEAQGPGNYEVILRATDRDGLFSTESFFVTVLEVNRPPVLEPIANQQVDPGTLVNVFLKATDPDLPANSLTYSLSSGAPAGATLDANTGRFDWTAPEVTTSTQFPITVRVTDNGSPSLSASQTFTVTVNPVKDCIFDDELTQWQTFESGGSEAGRGTVAASGCQVTITEGDSFIVGLQHTFTIPDTPTAIQFTFAGPSFDTTDTGFIRDAFEVALVDQVGNPLVAPFAPGRDVFFNMTEGMIAAATQRIQVVGNTVTVGLNGIAAGTEAAIVFRLANDDRDLATSVTISDIAWINSDLLAPNSFLPSPSSNLLTPPETTVFQWSDSTPEQFRTLQSITAHSGRNVVPTNTTGTIRNTTAISPQVKWWKREFESFPSSKQVGSTPVVIDVTGDGKPEIVVITHESLTGVGNSTSGGVLRVLSGADGSEIWSVGPDKFTLTGYGAIAAADINGDGNVVIVVSEGSGSADISRLLAFNHDGTLKWRSPVIDRDMALSGVYISDLNGDGISEIVSAAVVLDGRDGAIVWNGLDSGGTGRGGFGFGNLSVVADLTLDGQVEVVAGNSAYKADGSLLWNAQVPDGLTAIGNFDDDQFPEIVLVALGKVYLLEHDGTTKWGPIAIPGGGRGGPPVIADFTGDGKAEIGIAGSTKYVVFDRDGTIVWETRISDVSSSMTGSTVFDLDGDGRAEVIYNDEYFLRIFDGRSGAVLYEVPNSSGTAIEHPIVADVDGNGSANIVAVSNQDSGFGPQNGVLVLESEGWVATRPIWNQYSYHITNINDDGTIPRQPANSWQVYNNYRQNLQVTGTQFGPPQLTVGSPLNRATAGQTLLLSGKAVADGFISQKVPNSIVQVTVNGLPVEGLDAMSQFYETVVIQPGINTFTFTATDAAGQQVSAALQILGTQRAPNDIDFSRYTDITGSFSGRYFRTSFNEQIKVLHVDLATRNDGQFTSDVPLLVGVKNISDPRVSLVGFDGFTPDGIPFYDYSAFVAGGRLGPGQLTDSPTVLFHNPQRVQFDYELVFYSKTNSAPSFTSVPKVEGLVGKEYRYVATAVDEESDPLSFRLLEAPAGMSINSQTGVVTWTPQATDIGAPRVAIEVSDSRGGRATQSFTLNVNVPPPNRPPVITSVPRTQASISQSDSPPPSGPIDLKNWTVLDYEIGDGPSRWDIAEDGLSVTQRQNSTASAFLSDFALSNQVVEGKFSSSGGDDDLIGFVFGFQEPGKHFIFDWKRGTQPDACGTAEAGMTIKYVSASSPFTCTDFWATNPQNGRVDTLFHNSIPWEIGIEYVFRLSIEDTNVTVEVTQGSQVLESTVISTDRLTQGKFGFYNYSQADVSYVGFTRQAIVGVPYQYQVTAVDADNDLIRYALTNLPQGMSIDNQTGLVRWSPTPDQIGDHEVEVEVSDGRGGIATQKFVVCVHPDPSNHAPIIVSDPPTLTSTSTPYTYTVQAVDADSDRLTYKLISGPSGLTVAGETGLLAWTTPTLGTHPIVVQVNDGRGGLDTQEFQLRVAGNGLGTIRGIKWNDLNGDGAYNLSPKSESKLPGWTIYLDQNQNGRLDDGERSTVTDTNGNYEFTGLPPETYFVREVPQDGWQQTMPGSGQVSGNLLVNGSFEIPGASSQLNGLGVGSQAIPGWIVTANAIDAVLTDWPAADGSWSVDLDGVPGFGAISQAVQTVPGTRYRMSFQMSSNNYGDPIVKTMQVEAGSTVRNYSVDITGRRNTPPDWTQQQFDFTATETSTLIEFRSTNLTGGFNGIVIDNVVLQQVDLRAGEYTVSIQGNEQVSGIDFGNRQRELQGGNPEFTSQPQAISSAGELYRYLAQAYSAIAAPLTFKLAQAPSGMTVHPQLGIVAWRPTVTQIGKHTVILQATDTAGNAATQVFEIEVVLPNTAPVFTVIPSTNAIATRAYESVVTAQDAEGDAVSYRLVSGPTGMTLNQRNVLNAAGTVLRVESFLAWTPTTEQVGSHPIRIEARDARGAASELEFTIQVAATGSNRLPTITSQARKNTLVDRIYAYAPTANDPDAQSLVWSLSQAPAGMVIIPGSGLVTWTPTAQHIGDHSVTLSVSDGAGGTTTQSFTLNVSNEFRNTAPLIVSNPRLYALEGQAYRYDVVSEDEDYDAIRYRLAVAPHGMSIDANQGTIRWTPTSQQFGEHSVVIEALDPFGATDTQRFTVSVNCVNSPPMIVSVPLTTALTERIYIYPVRANDLEGGLLQFKLLSSPTGMSIDAGTGLIRWNPTTQQLGEHTVTVEVTDEAGAVGLQVYKILVRSAEEPVDPNNPNGPKLGNRAPLFTSTPVFNAKSGAVYQYPASTIDPDGDLVTYSLDNPPAGMSISTAGLITWTPALGTSGTFPITIAATDVHGARTNQAFVLNVAANSAPVITSQPVTTVAAGAVYRYAVRATDADSDPLVYALEGAPAGMSIDRLGLIRWETKPSDLGTKSFTIRVTDSFGQSTSQAVSLVVAADTQGPIVSLSVFGGRPDRSNGIQVDVGSTYTVQVQAADDVGVVSRALKVNGIEQPLSSSFAVQLVASQLGIVELIGSARDAAGNETPYNLTITVVDPASANLVPNDPTAPPRNGGSDPNDKRAPFVDITSPELGASVSNVVTIRGTVDDPEDRLWYWRLYYARMDQISTAALDLSDTDWVMIRQGTTEVINGDLGQFDPITLSRDGYVIALVAYDLNGAGEVVGTVVNVEGNLQVGNFRLEFTDVTIPLAGIPITINRVYDTVNANDEGDFGFGWSFGVQDPRILEAGAIGQGGGLNFSTDKFIPDKTKVFLTNPEGRRVGFTYKEELISASLFGGIFRPYFVADPGVYDTLTIDETQVARGGIIGALAQGINPDNYTLTTKSGMQYRYNQNAGLQTITDRNGNVVTFSDTEIRHSLGQTIQLVRDHRGRIREIQLPTEQNQAVRNLLYTYDASGNLIRFTDQTGLVTRYEYLSSPAHYLDKVYDPLDKKVIEAIYENRRFVGMFDALGNEVGRQSIDTARNRGIVRDANGFETVLIYNDRGNVIEEIDPLGFKTIRRYEDPRNVDLETTIIDRNGNVTNREYDSRGNATRIIERGPQSNPLARPVVTEFTYDSSNNVTSIKNSAGATTAFAFDASGQVTRIANALTATSGFTYDSQGRRQSFTDFNGNTTRFEYDEACPCGSPSRLINPDGTYQTFEYNDYGQVTAERTFEANGTLVEQKLTEYDAAGKVTREVMGAGNDPLHPTSEIRKFYSGNLLDWEIIVNPVSLNADGSLKESPSTPVAQRKSRITDYVYDAADRLIRQIDANGGVVNFRYDAQGNRLLLQDPVGNITTWVYDGNNRMIEERDPLYWDKYIRANPVEFAGKVGDALLDQVIVANRKASGASLANNQGAPHVRSFGYDPNGNQIEIIDRNNRRREFSHDHAGRMIEERWYNPIDHATAPGALVETVNFTYDTLGNMLTAGDSNSRYLHTYDVLNRLTSVDNNPLDDRDVPRVILSYAYDAQGNVISTSDDAGVTVASEYDSRNRLAIRRWFDADVPAGQDPDVADARVDFFYTAAGREREIRRYSDLTGTNLVGRTLRTYDLAGRSNILNHVNAVDEVLAGYDYDYDFSGLLTNETRTHQDPQYAQEIEYRYDLTGQLVAALFEKQDDEYYEYDLNGNRKSATIGNQTSIYAPPGPANQLTSDGTYDYEYDGEGNMVKRIDRTTGETRTFSYDHRNRIVQFDVWSKNPTLTNSGAILIKSSSYVTDLFGRSVSQEGNDFQNGMQVQSFEKVIYERNAQWSRILSDDVTERYLVGERIDSILAISNLELQNSWPISNAVSSVIGFLDSSATLTQAFGFSAFGIPIERTSRSNFMGRPYDSQSGTFNFRTRIYDPSMGLFTSRDTVGFNGGDSNLLRFVGNSPLTFVDPTGSIAIISYARVLESGHNRYAAALIGTLHGFGITNLIAVGAVLETGGNLRTAFELTARRVDEINCSLQRIVGISDLGQAFGKVGSGAGQIVSGYVLGGGISLRQLLPESLDRASRGATGFYRSLKCTGIPYTAIRLGGFIQGSEYALERLMHIWGL